MELQQVSVEKLIPHPLGELKKTAELSAAESQAEAEAAAQVEREDFVKRIEAYCDCV